MNIDFLQVFLDAPVGLCVTEHRIMCACNKALASMFGYSVERMAQQSLELLYPSVDEFERIGQRILPILSQTGHYADDRIMRRANGELFWCHVSGNTLSQHDPFARAIWAFEDVSQSRPVTVALSPREREVGSLLATGKTSKEIARSLQLSPRTVEMYRSNLLSKYCVSTSTELIQKLLIHSRQ
ncbi:helix-turn-helix transcriptional regulator [Parvibium lacunae]|uniref:PAS domain-containing protein n=1 Tax=Parvibium lacunae TaxID=1888893 RepID=A0A368L878_9BURK|nr:LuxR C-terminal-related transcriptional regulator [Parvibium lacunae]RCS59908.1 PAS domain-containing protein [Parvibium lacunae]